ncbi:MAG: glycerate kinase [Coriobacteriales bacterium]|jgi:glycerate kinase
MRFLFASDSFKGSLSSEDIGKILTEAAREIFPGCVCKSIITADGGEGTLQAIKAAKGGEYINAKVKDPLFRDITAKYLVCGDCAVISVAEAIGLTLLTNSERDPLKASSYGAGQLIADAIGRGYKNIYIALGGSATCDGGIGALTALGVEFFDENGDVCKGVGEELIKIKNISLKNCRDFSGIGFNLLCDVKNALLGKSGASFIFAPQKGADCKTVLQLEAGMQNFAKVVQGYFNCAADFEGGGAAGGLGFAFKIFLNAEIKSGINYILHLNNFDGEVLDADCVFSGEGKLDGQTCAGKVVSGIAERCKKFNKPLICIVGCVGDNTEPLYDTGVAAIFSIINKPMDISQTIENATDLYSAAAKNIFRLLKTNMLVR